MSIAVNLKNIRNQIASLCQQQKRSINKVTLVAVSKRKPVADISEAMKAGQVDFGENYLQEALEKIAYFNRQNLPTSPIWHYIGSIQSNKTRKIAEHFAWVHTVDSFKIAKRLSEQRPTELPPINICLQVNIDDDANKSGLAASRDELLALCQQIQSLPQVKLRGLMCIPMLTDDKTVTATSFAKMQTLLAFLNTHDLALDTLSMGMSDDMDIAIANGATMVRVGSAIFGARD